MRTVLRALVIGSVAALVPAAPALGQETPPPTPEQYMEGGAPTETAARNLISIVAENEAIESVVSRVQRLAGVNINVSPEARGIRVSFSLFNVPWRSVVQQIIEDTGCRLEEREAGRFVLTKPPSVEMQFNNADVRGVITLLATLSGKNVLIGPRIQGTITLNLRDVPWMDALRAIVQTVDGNFVVVEEGPNLIRVVLRSDIAQQLETRIYPLTYLRPPPNVRASINAAGAGGAAAAGGGSSGVATPGIAVTAGAGGGPASSNEQADRFPLLVALRQILQGPSGTGPGGAATGGPIAGESIQYDGDSNSFIVRSTAPKLAEVERIIRAVDVEPAQVLIEVKFVSTDTRDFDEFGIRFSDGTTTGVDIRLDQLGAFPFRFGEGVETFERSFAIPAQLNPTLTSAAFRMLQSDQRNRIVQAPSLFVLDGHSAVIFVGENVPFAVQSTTQDINGNALQTITEAEDSPVAVGFTLYIQPHVVRDHDQVILTVVPILTQLNGTTSALAGFERFSFGAQSIDLPRIAQQSAATRLLLRDGGTAIIGGLLTERDRMDESRIPILSRIPVLGNLFKFRTSSVDLENLLIFITPRIVRNSAQSDDIYRQLEERENMYDPFFQRFGPEGPAGPILREWAEEGAALDEEESYEPAPEPEPQQQTNQQTRPSEQQQPPDAPPQAPEQPQQPGDQGQAPPPNADGGSSTAPEAGAGDGATTTGGGGN